jgi:uncharacterized DUF497 family protein
MEFEWDRAKSRSNMLKHGIDFKAAQALWPDEYRIEIQAPHYYEFRKLLFARLNGNHWAAVFTERVDAVRIISVRRARKDEVEYYEKKEFARTATELERRIDAGESVFDVVDMSKATVIRHGKKVRITLDVAESLVNEIDAIRKEIGVDRGALIKVWQHERIKQEKAAVA